MTQGPHGPHGLMALDSLGFRLVFAWADGAGSERGTRGDAYTVMVRGMVTGMFSEENSRQIVLQFMYNGTVRVQI